MALDIALRGAETAGASIELIDLRDYELPFCAGKMGELERSEDVVRLRQAIQQAQGVILATPVYHGSFSGAGAARLTLWQFCLKPNTASMHARSLLHSTQKR